MTSPVHSIISHLQASPSVPPPLSLAQREEPLQLSPQMPVVPRAETAAFFSTHRESVVERNRIAQLKKTLGTYMPPTPQARFSS